jgi:hypothetical protein
MIYDVNSPLYKSFLSTKGQAASQAGKSAVPKKRVLQTEISAIDWTCT